MYDSFLPWLFNDERVRLERWIITYSQKHDLCIFIEDPLDRFPKIFYGYKQNAIKDYPRDYEKFPA